MRAVDAFEGIPYAAAPVGEFRFRPPQPFAEPWAPKIRSAKELGHMCPQMSWNLQVKGLHSFAGDEDCLFLNVYRPHGANNQSNIPVIFWIHGGGFIFGDSRRILGGTWDLYNPMNIVKEHGHVFVGINYRLGGFGYWASPELAAEQKSGTTGNYGLLDQRAALQWVQRNILAFGGNPSKVTIQGESAGGLSVFWHLYSPGSKGLFHSAIAESGTLSATKCFIQNKSDAFKFYGDLASMNGCNGTQDQVACLRKLPQQDIILQWGHMVKDYLQRAVGKISADIPEHACALYPMFPFGALVDGSDEGLPDWPHNLKPVNKVPLLAGTNVNEGAMFGWMIPLLWGDTPYSRKDFEFTRLLEWWLPKQADRLQALKFYNNTDLPETIEKIDRVVRDTFFHCPLRDQATSLSSQGIPVHVYVFSFAMHTNVTHMLHDLTDAHGFELPFVFRNWIGKLGNTFLEPAKYRQMSDIMSCTWASFVKCQKPKCSSEPSLKSCDAVLEKVPEWPAFSAPNSRKYISFKADTTIEEIKPSGHYPHDEFAPDEKCDFWKTVDWSWQGIRKKPAVTVVV
jgi:para-nitrobenzyl esterase